MTLDPGVITAIVGLVGSAYAIWRTARQEEHKARIQANAEGIKVSAEFDVKREELLTAGIEAHFNRLEDQIRRAEQALERAEQRIDELTERVQLLETERDRMIQWMAFNRLGWPPPEDSPI